jgi:hypothetical protein
MARSKTARKSKSSKSRTIPTSPASTDRIEAREPAIEKDIAYCGGLGPQLAPGISISLVRQDGTMTPRARALVDTGCDVTSFPSAWAEELGIDLSECAAFAGVTAAGKDGTDIDAQPRRWSPGVDALVLGQKVHLEAVFRPGLPILLSRTRGLSQLLQGFVRSAGKNHAARVVCVGQLTQDCLASDEYCAQKLGSACVSESTGANRSPRCATRSSTSAARKARWSGSPESSASRTSSHSNGVETLGWTVARSE